MIYLEDTTHSKKKDIYFLEVFDMEYESPEFTFKNIKKKENNNINIIEVDLNVKKNRNYKKIF